MLQHQVGGVVAEDAHARVAHDLAAGDVGHGRGQQVEDGLRDPGAVDVDAVEHHVDAPELVVLLDVCLFILVRRRPVGGNNRHADAYSCGHAAKGSLVPAHASHPLVLGAGVGVGSQVGPEARSDVVEGLRAEQVDRVQELAVLQQVPVAIPQPRDGVAVRERRPLLVTCVVVVVVAVAAALLPGPDALEAAAGDREALRGGPAGIMGPDSRVAVRGGRGRRRGRERLLGALLLLLLLEGEGQGQGDEGGGD